MEDSRSPEHRLGGNVEPVDRATIIKGQMPIPDLPAEVRFELRDPFAEVTYRSNSFSGMTLKADRLGANRFVAITPDGKRSQVAKDSTGWHEPEALRKAEATPNIDPSVPKQPAHAAPSRSDALAMIDADAEREARISRLEAGLNERYLIRRSPIRIGDVSIGQTEYRHRGDSSRIAFTESAFRLSTETNNPSVARSMVDVAETRNWRAVRVTGNEDFKRMVWLESSLRNVRTVGYEPVPGDQELLAKERDARQRNRIEPASGQASQSEAAAKQSARGGGGRKAVLAALEAVLVAKQVPENQREAVMAAAAENLAQRLRNGEVHRVKVYDRAAPSQRPTMNPAREPQRDRERAAPTR